MNWSMKPAYAPWICTWPKTNHRSVMRRVSQIWSRASSASRVIERTPWEYSSIALA